MSLSIGSPGAGSAGLGGQLFIERFSLGSSKARAGGTPPSTGAVSSGPPGFSRLLALVERVSAEALEASRSGGDRLDSGQAAIDAALAEIGQLVGQRLVLGGAKNAVVEGLDTTQVLGFEVRSLSPNASATFAGVSINAPEPPSVAIPGLSRLRSRGGALTVGPPNAGRTISFTAGTSTNEILGRLSRLGGIEASSSGDTLRLRAPSSSSPTSLRVSAQYGRSLAGGSAYEVEGVDSAQIVSVDTTALAAGSTFAVSGSRQTASAEAELTYAGDGSAVSGTASFSLTGSEGSTTLSVTQGESLAVFAQRINDATADTGVIAEVEGDTVSFRSVTTGSTAVVSFSDIVRDTDVTIEGVNASQVTDLQVAGLADEASLDLSGSVTQAADLARQVYRGDPGRFVAADADFTLTGSLGSVVVALTEGEALADVADRINGDTGTTGVSASTSGDALYFESTAYGTAATVTIDNVTTDLANTVTGVNAAQIASFSPGSLPQGTLVTLAGEVTRAADNARQIYAGGVGATVVDDATFSLGGSLGSATIAITQGEALADVADRINDESATTGVAATVSGDNLEFTSTEVGSAANVQVTLESVAQYVSVDGVNAAQLTGFVVDSAEAGSINTLSGSVDSVATQGELTYTGFLGSTNGAATFTLTGELGSAQFSVTGFQSLASVRDEINAEVGTTGVEATLAGSTLTLTSTGYGSAAVVDVDVQSGSFNTNGGDGQGSAAGVDAQLTLNGQAYTSQGLDVSYDDGSGNQYTLTLDEGFSGTLDTVTVTSADGDFTVTGGDGGGNAVGIDAAATINGNAIVAAGETFDATIDGLTFTLQTEAGFSGVFDSITVESDYAGFDVEGGDANGSANGVDATALLNGVSYTATGNELSLSIEGANLDLTLAAGFVGAIDDITIRSEYQEFTISGGDGAGTAYGTDSQAIINGETVSGTGDTFVYESESGPLTLTFAADHQGSFDVFDVVARSTETRVFSAPAGSAGGASFAGGIVERDGNTIVLNRGGAVVALELAAGFRGQLGSFRVAAAGEVPVSVVTEPLDATIRNNAAQAVRSLVQVASGGEAAITAGGTHRALTIAHTALQRLQALSTGTESGSGLARRSLVGLTVDARV